MNYPIQSHEITRTHGSAPHSKDISGWYSHIFPFNIQIYPLHHWHIPINIPIISHQHTTNYTTPMVIPMIFPPSCHRIEFQFQHETTKNSYHYTAIQVLLAMHSMKTQEIPVKSLFCLAEKPSWICWLNRLNPHFSRFNPPLPTISWWKSPALPAFFAMCPSASPADLARRWRATDRWDSRPKDEQRQRCGSGDRWNHIGY